MNTSKTELQARIIELEKRLDQCARDANQARLITQSLVGHDNFDAYRAIRQRLLDIIKTCANAKPHKPILPKAIEEMARAQNEANNAVDD